MKHSTITFLSMFVVLLALVASPSLAGTISGLKTPAEVRDTVTMPAIEAWIASDKTDATGCGANDCCPDTGANDQCTGSAAPIACCSGAGTGTCNEEACASFAVALALDTAGWADDIETQYQFDGDWLCNSYPLGLDNNRRRTVCTTVSGTPLIDVARICSEIAGRHFSP